VASKYDIGARKMHKCILLKITVAVLYPAITARNALAKVKMELPIAKAT